MFQWQGKKKKKTKKSSKKDKKETKEKKEKRLKRENDKRQKEERRLEAKKEKEALAKGRKVGQVSLSMLVVVCDVVFCLYIVSWYQSIFMIKYIILYISIYRYMFFKII